jgi:hypothetical protein
MHKCQHAQVSARTGVRMLRCQHAQVSACTGVCMHRCQFVIVMFRVRRVLTRL